MVTTEILPNVVSPKDDWQKPTKTEVLWQHPNWLFVIIPVQEERWDMGSYMHTPNFPLFSAFCKRCNTYYTFPLDFTKYDSRIGKIPLPKYGCVGPDANDDLPQL
jgi:hypothetical protein